MFYVGKGMARRAWDFSPARRTRHHVSIIRKYGARNIVVDIIPQPDEASAFAHEVALIASLKAAGITLINLTDGGEGASGRPFSEAQAAGFALGRRSWAERGLSKEAMAAIQTAGHSEAARQKRAVWRASEAGKAHLRNLEAARMAGVKARVFREVVCASCNNRFMAQHQRATYCSKACALRAMRERRKDPTKADRPLAPYANSTTGVRGVYAAQYGGWKAAICISTKLIHLGTFATKEEAAAARLQAEQQYGKPRHGGRPRARCQSQP